MIHAHAAEAGIYVLSEGPSWRPESRRLSWVDIEAGEVLSSILGPASGASPRLENVSTVKVGGKVGFAVETAEGGFLIGVDRALGVIEASGRIRRSRDLVPEGTRFNDGRIDPQGRLVAGTLTLAGEGGDNVLVRLETDGSLTTLDDDLGLSNGLGWSPDGTWFYSIDTDARVVYRRRYGPDVVGSRERFIEMNTDSWPDGMSVDAEGNLWIAVWGGGEVRVFRPDGTPHPDFSVSIAAPHCSSVAFVGSELDLLVVTSASRDLDAHDRQLWPLAGGLFLAKSPVRGLATTTWAGSPLPSDQSCPPIEE